MSARLTRAALALALPLLLSATTLRAQRAQRARQAPADVARQWFDATMSLDWRGAARLVDPAQAATLRPWLVQQVAMADAMATQMREQMAADSTGGGDVYGVLASALSAGGMSPDGSAPDSATMRRLAGVALPVFAGSPTLGDLLALPDSALVAGLLQAMLRPRYPVDTSEGAPARRHMAAMNALDPVDANEVTVLGAVLEGDSVAHVVYRTRTPEGGGAEGLGFMGTPQSAVATTELRRRAGAWHARLTDETLSSLMGGMMMHLMMAERRRR